MKKKSLAVVVTAMAITAVVGIGATLAYLSDSTGSLTNKFTFTQKGINMTLDEAKIDANNKALTSGERVSANVDAIQNYQNIVPSMLMDKDPTVTIIKGSLNSNVFVSVNNANSVDNIIITDFNTAAWTEVTPATYGLKGAANTKYYVYSGTKGVAPEAGDAFKVVPSDSVNDIALEDVFQHVQAGNLSNVQQISIKDIVVKSAAIQADSVVDKDAAADALGMLGCTEA